MRMLGDFIRYGDSTRTTMHSVVVRDMRNDTNPQNCVLSMNRQHGTLFLHVWKVTDADHHVESIGLCEYAPLKDQFHEFERFEKKVTEVKS